ncbi:MAG: SAM-dependent chlorinase/fluorinase [Bacteroidia bacterium]|nr:SAM-dependent chlorinase/fluorinase [Bacteroidia bacterium]NND24640.1 SAM-dependent chlorinase/fluorinase [Flavobacteriaceae bacterium]MBT8278880.1 SAM-dependent chlorinase/fluorinase [Bacteroidia bacterium]NNK59633.1 SAM-dependent chlorinase/fluorinase [Flavobacteriaceae bacterium]NNL34048.1 SAM-dependent chlorinase/fluorinase [Flavobacteriaceae bacterium]
MAIITLTTDFGEKDHFAGAIKGAIYSELPDVRIVDISHSVSPFNIPEAAYIIFNGYNSFPKGTIHIIGIDSELNEENKHIAIKLDEHYFICANNGIMSMICAEIAPEKIVEINIHDKVETSFPVLDVFVKVACHIARGGTLEVIGKLITEIKPIKDIIPFVNDEKSQIIGSVIYIDNYGNVVTNIKRKFFDSIVKGRDYEVYARSYKFKTIHNKYCDIVNFSVSPEKRNDEGKGLVVFNSSDYLEIAVYKGNPETVGSASSLMGLNLRDTVTINFSKS